MPCSMQRRKSQEAESASGDLPLDPIVPEAGRTMNQEMPPFVQFSAMNQEMPPFAQVGSIQVIVPYHKDRDKSQEEVSPCPEWGGIQTPLSCVSLHPSTLLVRVQLELNNVTV